MARRISRQTHQQVLMQTWWTHAVIAFVFVLITYGFISLAIDSGNLVEYVAALAALWYGVRSAIAPFVWLFPVNLKDYGQSRQTNAS